MERSVEPTIPENYSVLDADGQVIFDASGAASNAQETSARAARASAARARYVLRAKPLGFVPKLLFGVAFGSLLFLGLAVAGVLLGIFLLGFLAKLTFSPKRR